VLLVNKWDLLEKETGTAEEFEAETRRTLPFLDYAPVLFLSALTGQRVHRIVALIDQVYSSFTRKIPSSQLGRLLEEVKIRRPPASSRGRSVNLYYWTQTGTEPVQITLFTNRPDALPENYRRFLVHQLYEHFELPGSPIRLIVKRSRKR